MLGNCGCELFSRARANGVWRLLLGIESVEAWLSFAEALATSFSESSIESAIESSYGARNIEDIFVVLEEWIPDFHGKAETVESLDDWEEHAKA